MRVEFQWSELPGSFRVCSLMGLIGGAYSFRLLSPLLFIIPGFFAGPPWGEELLQIILLYSLGIVLSVALPSVSMGGAIGLLTLPMSDEHRGILAFFVMISSIFPLVFFGFDILNFIASVSLLWPFMVFATVWIVLLWMGVRILRGRRPGST